MIESTIKLSNLSQLKQVSGLASAKFNIWTKPYSLKKISKDMHIKKERMSILLVFK